MSELGVSSDELRLRRGRQCRRRSGVGQDSCPPRAQDVAIERAGFFFRLRAKLALQGRDADLVLAQGLGLATGLRVEAHERPVDGLLQRIERHHPQAGLQCRLEVPRLALHDQQSRQRVAGELAQPLALGGQPLLERRFLHDEAGEEVALVERGGPGEGLRCPLLQRALEARHVHRHEIGGERDRLALQPERRQWFQALAKRVDGLAEVRPGLRLRHVAPEQGSELVSRVWAPGRHREIPEQRLVPAREVREDGLLAAPGPEATEECEVQPFHRGAASL